MARAARALKKTKSDKPKRKYTRRVRRVETAAPTGQPLSRPVRSRFAEDDVAVHAEATPLVTINETLRKRARDLVAHVRKQHGESSISLASEIEAVPHAFTTGIPELDHALAVIASDGTTGFPCCKIVQISGGESVGKSTLCKGLIAAAQRAGILSGFVDGEMSGDSEERFTSLGVDTSALPWDEEQYIEDAFQKIDTMIVRLARHNDYALVFVDSIAAFDVKSIDEKRDYDENTKRAAKASFLSANLGKLVHKMKGTKVGVVFVNQLRDKPNVSFGDPSYEPGGRALRHWSHMLLRMSRVQQIKDGNDVIGIKSKVFVKKSKIGVPNRQSFIDIMFDGRIIHGEPPRFGNE